MDRPPLNEPPAAPEGTTARRPLTFRRLFGLDRSGPPPPQTLAGAPLNPWTIPNAIGFLRLALIPVFLVVAFSSDDGSGVVPALLFALIAWGDYADGIAARVTGQYSRLGTLLDPITDRLLVASGLIPLKQVAVVPILGILIGNAMTATSIAGRRAVGSLTERRGEFEAALSIGFLDRDAALLVAREDAALALVPGMDQTRTVGLVTLPGAFVGMLLGGATPIQAAAVQLVVLVGLLLVQAIATALTLELVCRNLLGSAAGVGSPAHLSVQPR